MEDSVGSHVAGIIRSVGRRRCRRDRNVDGDANIRFDRAAVTLGGEVEVRGVGRRYSLGAVHVDLADAIDGDDIRILAAPVEDDGLTEDRSTDGSAVMRRGRCDGTGRRGDRTHAVRVRTLFLVATGGQRKGREAKRVVTGELEKSGCSASSSVPPELSW